MSINELEAQVLRIVGDNPDSPDVFFDGSIELEALRRSMSEAIQEITMLTGGHKTSFYIPLAKDVSFYAVRPKQGALGWIAEAWLIGEKRRLERTDLHRLNVLDPRWLKRRGNLDSYFEVGPEHFGVYPKPSASSDVLRLECVIVPDVADDTRRLAHLRDQFKWAVVDYAVGEYFASRGRDQDALSHSQSYAMTLGLAMQYPKSRERTWVSTTTKEPWPTEGNRVTP